MDGFRALVTALALGGALLLLAGGIGHAARPGPVRSLLARQALLPPALRAVAVPLLGLVEIIVAAGALGLAALAPGRAPAGYAVLAGSYALLAGYAELLRRRRPGVPCGCLPGAATTGLPVVVRALIFAVAAAVAAVVTGAAVAAANDSGAPLRPALELWLAAGVTATAGWLVPELLGVRSPTGDR